MLEYKLDFKLKYLTCQGFLTHTHTLSKGNFCGPGRRFSISPGKTLYFAWQKIAVFTLSVSVFVLGWDKGDSLHLNVFIIGESKC